jgi:hypothetical protein
MATQKELDDFDKLFQQDVQAIADAKTGPYAEQLQDLLHLSGQAATDGTIAITPTETYAQLIALVQRASQVNLSQAELKDRIVALGDTAVAIAKKVGGLAPLFA